MYKRFYGLARNPFEISPDPYFFCHTPRHNEALASLSYGVERRKGFVVVTGEVGTGKTLLVRCLVRVLEQTKVAFAYMFNPRLSVLEFLQYLMADLQIPATATTKGEMLMQINNFLIERHRRGSTAVLIIDEAHLLSWELLEEIRLLTNLETAQRKLLQIILVGQPELDRKLDSEDLRQLKQRIALRCQLLPLSEPELRTYIARRLQKAGSQFELQKLFSEDALAAIYDHSRGIPRLVNTLCENALIGGYARQVHTVGAEIVNEVAQDFRLDVVGQGASSALPEELPSRNALVQAFTRLVQMVDRTDTPIAAISTRRTEGAKAQ